ncbi:6-phosphofructokinase [Thermoanaerobacterium thermosaccharolyticum]|uniref:6-phosphofructokinase n=1 Tax=Thermoanaerobacterium thermosaccharolyticum TaxID=1517 RepID=UPI003D2D9DAC
MYRDNCIVAQSGGPTAVINSSLYGIINNAIKCGKFQNVYGGLYGVEGIIKGKIINILDLPFEVINKSRYSPAAALGTCRYRLKDFNEDETDYIKIFSVFKKYNIRSFFYIGGNDSMDTALKINKYAQKIGYDIKVIGVPKTIDNDLLYTDHCPGYGSAAKYIATTTLELALDSDAYDTNIINILEVMGRDAGWLAAASALAKKKFLKLNQLIYLPEVSFDEKNFLNDIESAYSINRNLFIVLSEGIVDKNGNYVMQYNSDNEKDSFGHIQLGGVSNYIGKILKKNISNKVKIKITKLGSTQRCAMHIASKVDFDEADLLGRKAVDFCIKDMNSIMVALERLSTKPYICDVKAVDLTSVCNKVKKVPLYMINERGNFVTDEFINYVEPLIYGNVKQPFNYDLPSYINLNIFSY